MTTTLLKDTGQTFIPANPEPNKSYPQIPKQNYRDLSIEPDVEEDRTLILSVSSDKPYLRWFGYEILEHSESAVDLSRFNDGAQVLFNHDRDQYIGVIEKAWLDGGKLYCKIIFDTHDLAEKLFQSVKAGIIRNVSIGYEIQEMKLTEQRDNIDYYTITRWLGHEMSLVTIPADASVGVGRSYFIPKRENSESSVSEDEDMEDVGSTATLEINEQDIRQQERDRVRGISALISKYGHSELGERAIDEGMTLVDARSLYLDKVTVKEKPVAQTITPVDLDNKDARDYRFLKAVGFAAGKLKPEQAGLELEVSDHIQETRMGGKPPEGIYVDQSRLVSFRAPYDTQTPAAAGNLIATDLLADRFIDALYNQSAFLSSGVTYLRDLTGNVQIPREETYTSGYWIGESQPITEDEGTFDKIGLSPHKLASLTKITYEMINQSGIDIELLMRSRLVRGLALELDRTIGFGSGIGEEPLGILSHPEVLSIVLGANGGSLNWEALIDMQGEIDNANAMMGGSFNFVLNSKTKARLMKTLDQSTGSGSWIWQQGMDGQGNIAGYTARCSNQIPNNLIKGTATNLTAAFFGDFSNVLLGIWSGLDVMVDPYSESTNAIIKVIAKQLADVQLTRGSYFCVCSDIQNN